MFGISSFLSVRPNTYLIDSQTVTRLCLQGGKNLHGHHPLPLLILFCRAEMAVEELFQWGELFKFPVRPLQDGFIGIIQPVALTFGYGIQSLCIELAVVDGDICIDGK